MMKFLWIELEKPSREKLRQGVIMYSGIFLAWCVINVSGLYSTVLSYALEAIVLAVYLFFYVATKNDDRSQSLLKTVSVPTIISIPIVILWQVALGWPGPG